MSALAGALTAVASPWTLALVFVDRLRGYRRPLPAQGRYEGLMPREEYERLIAEDLAWLRRQPPGPSRNHVEVVLRESPYLHYGQSARTWEPERAAVLGSTAIAGPGDRPLAKRRRP